MASALIRSARRWSEQWIRRRVLLDFDRVRVHCKAEGCNWRIHASKTRDKRFFKVKINVVPHTCSSINRCDDKMTTSGWVADRVMDWLKISPHLGAKELQSKIFEHYHIDVKYSRVLYSKEMALDRIFGNHARSYLLLYAFKEDVLRKISGSIVEIDIEVVDKDKVCFRRIFIALKPCIDGFL